MDWWVLTGGSNLMMIKLRSDRGISMMELMIVVVIIGIMAAMAAPQMDTAIKQMKFNNVGRQILSAYRLARSSAIGQQEPYGVRFDTSSGAIIVFKDVAYPGMQQYEAGDSVVRCDTIPASVDYLYTTFLEQAVFFSPDGSASATGDVFCYQEENGSYNSFSVYLTAATGHAKLESYSY
jgi:prepilin-type N-terminal cleavage/methylation domain-containing protein